MGALQALVPIVKGRCQGDVDSSPVVATARGRGGGGYR